MEIRPPGFLIRSWSQEMWFRPLLGGGCVDSTDGAEQTDGRNLPPERPRRESNPRPPVCKSRALPTELAERVLITREHKIRRELRPPLVVSGTGLTYGGHALRFTVKKYTVLFLRENVG